jgi:hypothetical protein
MTFTRSREPAANDVNAIGLAITDTRVPGCFDTVKGKLAPLVACGDP